LKEVRFPRNHGTDVECSIGTSLINDWLRLKYLFSYESKKIIDIEDHIRS